MSDAGPEDARRVRIEEAAQEMYELLALLWMRAECLCPRLKGPVFPPGNRDHGPNCQVARARALLARIDATEPG